MDCFTLEKFEVRAAPDNQILVLAKGSQVYKAILARAFPKHFMSRTFEDRLGRYEWGTYIHDVDSEVRLQIERLLQALHTYIYIEDDLTETFALDYHYHTATDRTDVGELVYAAKPYERPAKPSNFTKSEELANLFTTFIRSHPSYTHSDIIIPVPSSNPSKSFSLPTELVRHISNTTSILNGTGIVQKIRTTKPMKTCITPQEKINNVRNTFSLTSDQNIMGKSVILIDDVYASGFTINEVSQVLITGGALAVFGLVATKTSWDI